jgi:fructose-1-phosphate kinase PfkB-like protein
LSEKGKSTGVTQDEYICSFLDSLAQRFWRTKDRTRVVGVTVSDGAYEKHVAADGTVSAPAKTQSKFLVGEVIDLVGAGDSFRAGLISYVAKNIETFKAGSMDFTQAVQMGNLFASLYIKAPLQDRYGNIRAYERMLNAVVADKLYHNLEELMGQIKQD